jgi:uracil-DNA glycosylase family 4
MIDEVERNELLALLAWWREAGVETALEDSPVDWAQHPLAAPGSRFSWPDSPSPPVADPGASPGSARAVAGSGMAPGKPDVTPAGAGPVERRPMAPPSTPEARSTAPTRTSPVPRTSTPATTAAREAARRAGSLGELEAVLREFGGCPLKATAKNLCFYRGSPHARLMIIGEAPGREEDLEGRPFVGRAGQLLDRMLAAIGLAEQDVHITNVVYWRPPGNRTPTPEEVQICQPFLERQMALVAPEIVLTLGGPAAKAILDVTDGILRVRGKWAEIESEGRRIRVMPTLHPAYLLRTPLAKRQAWRDLLAVKLALDNAAHGEKT